MQLPLVYFDASAIEEVPLALWREAFETLGWPASLAGKQASFTHDDVRDAIRNDDLADILLHALEILHTLGTEAGREAITSIMKERRVELHELPDGFTKLEMCYLDNALRTDSTGQRDQSRQGAALSACSCERISAMMRAAITARRTLLALEPDAG